MTTRGRDGFTVGAAIPARNEQRAIASVIMLARQNVDRVLVVDDGSEDMTGVLARMAGAEVITHERSLGKGGGIATALKWAKNNEIDILVLIDGDGQHDPGAIPKLIKPILENGADMTIGSRWYHHEGRRQMPIHRVFGNWVLSQATSLSLSRTIKDSQSGFRAFHKRTFGAFHLAMETGFAVESEMITLVDKAAFRWMEVGIPASYEELDSSTHGSWYHGLTVLGRAMRILRIHKPARFFGLLSLVSVLLATIVVVYSEITYPDVRLLPSGAMFLVTSLGIIASFMVFSGIMLSGVNRVSDRMMRLILEGE